jgi:TIR domain
VSARPTGSASTPGPKVFITYRREETSAYAGRLYDAMVARFGEDNVFMDVDMAPGVDFVERIKEAVAACHVLIVVMGPRWATVENEDGRPRIADPEDFVRLEVETALRRPDVTPIPVLVGGARMPNREDLPPEVRPITRRNALELSDQRWRYDVGRLVSTLDDLLAELTGVHGVPSPERTAATEKAAPAEAAEAPGKTARPSIATATSAASAWLRRHLRLAIAVAVVAVAGLVVAILALGGGSTPVTEAGLPDAIPASVRPTCENRGRTTDASNLGADVKYSCKPPYGKSEGVSDGSLSYLQFPDANASQGLNAAKKFQLSQGYTLCELHAKDQIQRTYPDGDAWCAQSPTDQHLEIAWDVDVQRSPVMGTATFAAPTSPGAALNAWLSLIGSS